MSSQNNKYKNRNIAETINSIKSKLRTKLRTTIALCGWSTISQIKSNTAESHYLNK